MKRIEILVEDLCDEIDSLRYELNKLQKEYDELRSEYFSYIDEDQIRIKKDIGFAFKLCLSTTIDDDGNVSIKKEDRANLVEHLEQS